MINLELNLPKYRKTFYYYITPDLESIPLTSDRLCFLQVHGSSPCMLQIRLITLLLYISDQRLSSAGYSNRTLARG